MFSQYDSRTVSSPPLFISFYICQSVAYLILWSNTWVTPVEQTQMLCSVGGKEVRGEEREVRG